MTTPAQGWFECKDSSRPVLSRPRRDGANIDWTHGNALTYRPSTDTLLLSLRNPAVLVEVDRESGEVVAEYGGDGRDWGFSAGSEPFYFQHDARWTPDGNLLMMSTPREDGGALGDRSVAIEYALDQERHELVEVWRYGDEHPILATTHGGALRLANGGTLVNWGEPTGIMREVTYAGQTAWEVRPTGPAEYEATVMATVPFGTFYPPAAE